MKTVLLLAVLALLAGCDDCKCLDGHDQQTLAFLPIYGGTTGTQLMSMVPVYSNVWVCDRCEEVKKK